MHRLSKKFGSRGVALAGLLAAGLSSPAWAATPSNDLGQAWPQDKDASSAPGWHVYIFTRDGVKYIQINDVAGNVHAAIATASGQFMVLPMGSDASHVTTPNQLQAAGTPIAARAVAVYDDGAVRITGISRGGGDTQWAVSNESARTQPAITNAAPKADNCGCTVGLRERWPNADHGRSVYP